MIDRSIEKLVNYAISAGLIEESDRVWAENALLAALGLDSFERPGETEARELEGILADLPDKGFLQFPHKVFCHGFCHCDLVDC